MCGRNRVSFSIGTNFAQESVNPDSFKEIQNKQFIQSTSLDSSNSEGHVGYFGIFWNKRLIKEFLRKSGEIVIANSIFDLNSTNPYSVKADQAITANY